MSAISNFLTFLRSAIYAIDVRDGIADAIEQCYNDVNNPTLKTEALEAALQTKIDEGEMAALTIGDGTITAAKLASGVIDNTLATSGAAADAKKTGDEIAAVKANLNSLDESLGNLAELETGTKTDLVSAINEASKSGLSDAAKEALIACFESIAIWGDDRGRERIETLKDALYSAGGVFKWRASSRTLPSEMTYSNAVLVDDSYYEITKPFLQLGLSKTGGTIEVEMSLETISSVSSSLGIFAASTPWNGTKLLFLNGDVVVANVDEQGASDNLVIQDVDVTQFHKYKMSFDTAHTEVYIDGVYKGVGISSDLSGFIANSARCISDIYYFDKDSEYFYLDVDIEEGVQYAIKPIDENGNIWAYNAAVDEHNVGYMDSNGTPLDNGWITSPGRVSIYAYKTGDTTTRVKLPNTNGSLRILFKKADGTDFTEVPTCTFYLAGDGTVVATEEGDANEIL